MTVAAAVFVKTPGLSPIKTRLAKDLGEATALQIYQNSVAMTQRLLDDLSHQLPLEPFWAITEGSGVGHRLWNDWPVVLQRGDGLGPRMASVYNDLRGKKYSAVILLGADSPDLPADYLRQATESLLQNDQSNVVGPATDGGFYLFGSNCHFDDQDWARPRYSHAETLNDFIEHMGLKRRKLLILPPWSDLDTAQDLRGRHIKL